MAASPRFFLPWLVVTILSLTLVACEREIYPGAPPGYDFRTIQVKWMLDGNTRGIEDLYLETSGYENGQLIYTRMAKIQDTVTTSPADPAKGSHNLVGYLNEDGVTRILTFETKTMEERRDDTTELVRRVNGGTWLDVLSYLLQRDDLTPEQQEKFRKGLSAISDDELRGVGAEITEEKFLDLPVKHYVVPIAEGKAEVWMYGDIALKSLIEARWPGMEARYSREATGVILNKKLPDAPFEVPEGFEEAVQVGPF